MKILLQRVSRASVEIGGEPIASIRRGLLVFVGIEKTDSEEVLSKMAEKLLSYRVFADDAGKMNLSVSDIAAELLIVSQFTLAASTKKGLRPSFSSAAPPELAKDYYEAFVALLKLKHGSVEAGVFGADMQVSLINDGPVTFMLEF